MTWLPMTTWCCLAAIVLACTPLRAVAASMEEKAVATAWEWALQTGLSEQHEQAEGLKSSIIALEQDVRRAQDAQPLLAEWSQSSGDLAEQLLLLQHEALDAVEIAGTCVKAHIRWMGDIAESYSAQAPELESINDAATMMAAYEKVTLFGKQFGDRDHLLEKEHEAQQKSGDVAVVAAMALSKANQLLRVSEWWVDEFAVNPTPYAMLQSIDPVVSKYVAAIEHDIRLLDAFEQARKLILSQILMEWRQLISQRVSALTALKSSQAPGVMSEMRRSEAYVAESRAQLTAARHRVTELLTYYHAPTLARRLVASIRAHQKEVEANLRTMNMPDDVRELALAYVADQVNLLNAFVHNHRLNDLGKDAEHFALRNRTIEGLKVGLRKTSEALDCRVLLEKYRGLTGSAEEKCYVQLVEACLP